MFKDYPCVMQEGAKDCGACCLLTIIKTYGGNVSLEYLRELTRTTKEGTNAYLIMKAAEELGFSTRAVRGSIFDLEDNMFPCIAHVIVNKNMGHFIVIHKIDRYKKILTIADPAVGRRLMSYDEFLEITTNQFLLFTPIKKITYFEQSHVLKNCIFNIIQKNKSLFLSVFIMSLICVLINIVTSFNLQFIIDNALNNNSKNNLIFISIIMVFLFIFKALNNLFRNNILNYMEHEIDHILVTDIFKHLISLPYLYYKNRTTGEVISRVNDLSEVRETISNLFMTIFVDFTLVVFVFITLLFLNLKLTFIAMGIAFSYFFLVMIFNLFFKRGIKKIKEQNAATNSYLYESLNSIDTIKGLTLEDVINDKFNVKYSEYLNCSYTFNNQYYLETFFKELIDGLGITLLIFLGSTYVLNETLSLGELISFNSLIVYFLEPIKNVIDINVTMTRTKEALNRVEDLYSVKGEELSFDEKYTNNKFKGNIKINNLSFSYDDCHPILKDISLSIASGEKILIMGDSGSGKSTLVKLLLKYFKVDNQKIYIDDKDINYFNTKELRDKISYVSQNEIIYNDTLYNNVTISKYINYDEFLKIAKITHLDELFNQNPLGASMMIEENGFNLSGGERQRIMLSRALVRDSDIYILDESLSQIDIAKERLILKELFKKYKTKTFIIISHRCANEDLYDRKINLKEGVITS